MPPNQRHGSEADPSRNSAAIAFILPKRALLRGRV